MVGTADHDLHVRGLVLQQLRELEASKNWNENGIVSRPASGRSPASRPARAPVGVRDGIADPALERVHVFLHERSDSGSNTGFAA
jgi:hypothetical protein